MENKTARFAVFIDGDNINPDSIELIIHAVTKRGKALIKNVYVNHNPTGKWEKIISDNALRGVWVPNNIKGKNSADIALVVDAMSTLYERSDITDFCIVSSDSDFTALIKHITTKDKDVLGIGRETTPPSVKSACLEFLKIESLEADANSAPSMIQVAEAKDISTPRTPVNDFEAKVVNACCALMLSGADTDDRRFKLSDIREKLREADPDFSSREYAKMPGLVDQITALAKEKPIFRIEEEPNSKPKTHWLILEHVLVEIISAYKQAVDSQGDEDGWVLLSAIGQYAGKPSYGGYRKSSSVVTKLIEDYPGILEMKHSEGEHPSIRPRQ